MDLVRYFNANPINDTADMDDSGDILGMSSVIHL